MQKKFFLYWILANALTEAVGLGTTFALGIAISEKMERFASNAGFIIFGALFAVVLGILLEGILVGIGQSIVLRRVLPELSLLAWTRNTSIGAGVAWLLGMIPSTILSLRPSSQGSTDSAVEPPAIVVYLLAVLMGLVLGPVLAFAQVWVLKRHVSKPYFWIPANALAWSVGMLLIFVGMDFVPWKGGYVTRTLAIFLVCGIAGTVVGAIHGWFLMRYAFIWDTNMKRHNQ